MPATLTESLDRQLARITQRRGDLGAPVVHVDSPALGVAYRFGEVDRPFHAASVGKLVAAVVAGQLIDEGALRPDTRIADVLPARTLDGLYLRKGVDHARDITLEHLLIHTSGIDDFFEGRPNLVGRMIERPDEFWTPDALLDWVRANQRPHAAPGRRFRYSDTGFLLLELVLEAATGRPYGELAHARVFDPLGMSSARLHLRTRSASGQGPIGPLPPGRVESDLAPAWIEGTEVIGFQSVSLDTGAAGALGATAADLAKLARAAIAGDLVSPERRMWLIEQRNRFRWGIHYGAGTMQVRMGELAPLMGRVPHATGHLGVLAAHLWHVPEYDADIVMTFHSTREMTRSFRFLASVLQQLGRQAKR